MYEIYDVLYTFCYVLYIYYVLYTWYISKVMKFNFFLKYTATLQKK